MVSRPHVSDMTSRVRQRRLSWLLLPIFGLALALRLYALDTLPGELYGDIAIVYEYMAGILAGRWPVRFVLSAGPFYHYLIAPVVALGGLQYYALKIGSVVISLLVLGGTYALGRVLLDEALAVIATLIAAVSSWLLIFSRLGNSQIAIPLLTVGALFFAVRLARDGHAVDAVGCALVSVLGLYTYPQTFFMPPVMFLTLAVLIWTGTTVRRRHLLQFAGVTLLGAVPFGLIVAADPANFFTGYIGGKLDPAGSPLQIFLGNVARGLLALHVRGDIVFRSNPDRLPHLDPLSGALFLAGIVFWLQPARRRLSPALLIPLVLLQLPSMLVLSVPQETPSASRTIGIAPIAYLLAASGLWWLWSLLGRRWAAALLGVALLTILAANADRYFRLYAAGLPDGNTPFGRIIAEYIDSLPPGVEVYMFGCCWGEWSQPEPKGVQYVLRAPRMLRFVDLENVTCEQLRTIPPGSTLIWAPDQRVPAPQLQGCSDWFPRGVRLSPRGARVFNATTVPTRVRGEDVPASE